jgi:outer membrane protein insertion porin family
MKVTAAHFYILLLLSALTGLQSCKLNQYPVGKPYAAKYKINVIGDFKEEERKELARQLDYQVDDSLRYSKVQKKWLLKIFPYYQKVYHSYDTDNIIRTREFFRAAYVANGYFRGGETTDSIIFEPGNTNRHTIIFNAYPRKNHVIDTVIYDIGQPQMQQLALQSLKDSYVKKNDLYSQSILNAERERLVNLYRNNGFLKISREDFRVTADTINPWLIKFTTDPIEQVNNLQKAAAFNENPTTGIRFRLSDNVDTSHLRTYYVGRIFIQPDNIDGEVTPPYTSQVDKQGDIIKQYIENKFKDKVFERNLFLKKGQLYRQSNYDQTYSTFTFMGPWQQVVLQPVFDSANKTDTVDFRMQMLPYAKFLSERKLEGSINSYSNDASQQANNSLWGINFSQIIKNRNFGREAIQTSFVANIGLELGGSQQFVNAAQGKLSYNMLVPKFVFPLPARMSRNLSSKLFRNASSKRTLLSAGTSYTSRFNFFQLTDVSLSHSLQFKTRNNWTSQVSFVNIERKFLNRTALLDTQITRFPILAFIFNDGLILGGKFTSTKILGSESKTRNGSIRVSGELSGLPYSFLNLKEFNNNLFSFIKLEYDGRHYRTWKKTSLAFRTYVGLGVPLQQKRAQNNYLPFFRQFTAGGPNSMRGWAIRNLNSYSTRTSADQQVDYYGDVQAELNLEYRFTVAKLLGIPIKSALFVDAGNIWNWRPYERNQVPYNLSSLQRVYNDIAIASGTSLRVDFDYFLIRLDFGLRLKDPPAIGEGGSGWFTNDNIKFTSLRRIKTQLGINFPF